MKAFHAFGRKSETLVSSTRNIRYDILKIFWSLYAIVSINQFYIVTLERYDAILERYVVTLDVMTLYWNVVLL